MNQRALLGLFALTACRIAQPLGVRADASTDSTRDASDDRREELTWRYGGVAAGGLRSCATVAGYAFCWGSPWGGALGQMRETPSPAPVLVPRVETVDDLVMGDRFTCARSLGEVWCWGENDELQLGAPGDTRATPDRVPGLSDVRALTASSKTACARRGDGAWWCWGEQRMGEAREVEALRGATSVALGQAHRCGLWPEGRLRCTGANNAGQLGDGTAVDRTEMVDAVGDDGRPLGGVVEARASVMNTCALLGTRREVRCWGALTPLPVVTLRADEALRTIGVGELHVCAITDAGRALCWGRNAEGELGDGTTTASGEAVLSPVVMPEGVRLGALAVGARHACAMELSGEALWCWGFNASGQLGGGDLDPHLTAVRVALPDR
jgi:alpha-tubulin suppressor-like RCC1 family protein